MKILVTHQTCMLYRTDGIQLQGNFRQTLFLYAIFKVLGSVSIPKSEMHNLEPVHNLSKY